MNKNQHKAGFVAIVGAPNAGKSTLLNYILGEKVAAVTSKPQTTRHRILGVHTLEDAQIIFWDTPGLHDPAAALLNREMMNRALAALADADLIVWVVDAERRGANHKTALELLQSHVQNNGPAPLVALNKIDLEPDKRKLLPLTQEVVEALPALTVVPISAQTGDGVSILLEEITARLPENPPFYPEDTLTDQPERLIAAEMVREAVFKLTNQEIPYATAVTVDTFKEETKLISIEATIHVERDSQKGVIIGKGGERLKSIGQMARLNIERMVGTKVFLKLFVRTTRDWTKKRSSILEFGYGD